MSPTFPKAFHQADLSLSHLELFELVQAANKVKLGLKLPKLL